MDLAIGFAVSQGTAARQSLEGVANDRNDGQREPLIAPSPWLNRLFADHLVDGGKRGGRLGEFPIGAQRIGLVEKLVDVVDVGFAQRVGLELVTQGLLGRNQLLDAFVVLVPRIGVAGIPFGVVL